MEPMNERDDASKERRGRNYFSIFDVREKEETSFGGGTMGGFAESS